MDGVVIAPDDPARDDVRRLLERHLAFARETSPPEDVHALDLDGLRHPSVTFFSARRRGDLVAIGALKEIEPAHGELKSMHTGSGARRQGTARAMVVFLLDEARRRGYRRVSLETGTEPEFAPARALYASCGFTPCEPFAHYRPSPNSAYFTIAIG